MVYNSFKSSDSQQFDFNLYAIHQLQEIRIWTLMLGVLGFALILAGLIATIWNLIPHFTETEVRQTIVKIPILCLSAIVMAIPGYYLIRFSVLSGKALKTRDSILLGQALSYQKRYYRSSALLIAAGVILFLLLEVWAMQPVNWV